MARKSLRDRYVAALKKAQLKYEGSGNSGVSGRLKELIGDPEKKPLELKPAQGAFTPHETEKSSNEGAKKQQNGDIDSERAILGKWVSEEEDARITFFKSGNVSCPAIRKIKMPRMEQYYLSYDRTFSMRGRSYDDYASATLDEKGDTLKVYCRGKSILLKREAPAKGSLKGSSEK